jgi:hypothetical protein
VLRVTADTNIFNHVLKLGRFGGTMIFKPADFLEIQAQAGRGR